MNSAAYDWCNYMVANLGYVLGGTANDYKSIYVSSMPDEPFNCVGIFDLPAGRVEHYTECPSDFVVNIGIKIRGNKYLDVTNELQSIVENLNLTQNYQVVDGLDTYTYLSILQTKTINSKIYKEGNRSFADIYFTSRIHVDSMDP